MILFLKKIYRLARRVLFILRNIPRVGGIVGDPERDTYYPEDARKSKTRIHIENCWWLCRHGELNGSYYLLGLDRKRGPRLRDVLAYSRFKDLRNEHNHRHWIGDFHSNYTALLKDKFVFNLMCRNLRFPTPRLFALCINDRIHWLDSERVTGLDELLRLDRFDAFCKTILGERADGAFPVEARGGRLLVDGTEVTLERLAEIFRGGFVIQERIRQHPRMAELYPKSINTLRLVTVNTGRRVTILVAAQKIGARGSTRDNWAAGGLYGGIDAGGRLMRDFFFKPGHGGRVSVHPDTGVTFAGFEIPFYREAIEMALDLHRYLYGLHSIGWDVAIGESGPLFIEGNDNWEFDMEQVIFPGSRERFLAFIREDCGYRS